MSEPKYKVGQKVYLKNSDRMGVITEVNSMPYEGEQITMYTIGDSYLNEYWYEDDISDTPEPVVKTIYDLNIGDPFYVLMSYGIVHKFICEDSLAERTAIAYGNAFMSSTEARENGLYRILHQKLKKYANGYKFKPYKFNYFLTYSTGDHRITVDYSLSNYNPGIVYFESVGAAKAALESIGEDVLETGYFGIGKEPNNE